MPRDSWFYAVDNTELGPVSAQDLKTLAAAEKINPRTLVWQEGMPDWIPAEKVPGLFASGNAAPAAAPTNTPGAPPIAAPPKEAMTSPNARASSKSAEPAKTAEPSPRSTEAASRWTEPPPQPTSAAPRRTLVGEPLQRFARPLSLLVFGIGLFFMLTARGCDALSNRYAARLQSLDAVTVKQFDDASYAASSELEAKRDEAQKRGDASAVDVFNERLTKLNAEKTAEKDRLARGSWRTLAQSARDAEANSKMWGFWRECLFVFGLVLLTAGSAAASFTAVGGERWFFLVVLGGIIFSLLGSAVAVRFGL